MSAPILDMWVTEHTIIRHSIFKHNIISLRMFLLDCLLMDTITSVAFHLVTLQYNAIHFFYSHFISNVYAFLNYECLTLLSKTVTVHIFQFHSLYVLEHLCCSAENSHALTHTPCPHSMWEHYWQLPWLNSHVFYLGWNWHYHNQPESNSPQCGRISSAGGHCTHHSLLHYHHPHLDLATFSWWTKLKAIASIHIT